MEWTRELRPMNVKHPYRSSLQMAVILLLSTWLAGCGINTIPTLDEQVKAAWAQVQNQYQRRTDLIPNLTEVVKGYAKHEEATLTAVTEARAKATSIQVDATTLDNPEKLKQFQQAQDQLSGALSRLMVVSERYPDLKANQNFLALQSQLEGTENRISVARRDFILAVQKYNTEIRTFPGRLWHSVMYSDLPIRETFEASAGSEQAPQLKF
jgi:LemA protein